jgi:hypothetical protein
MCDSFSLVRKDVFGQAGCIEYDGMGILELQPECPQEVPSPKKSMQGGFLGALGQKNGCKRFSGVPGIGRGYGWIRKS